ncbi:hypothetical protein C8Q74DRAFT_1439743 [Fomes fomentarius]|nr:hypothetical protein C8Q74DRAFT_1439743 [Fomes fomentarius]
MESAPATSSDSPVSPGATTSTVARPPRPVYLPQGPAVTRAYAVKLDQKCIYRWGESLYDELYPGKRERMSKEEFRANIDRLEGLAVDYLVGRARQEFPNLPSLRRASIYVRCPRWAWLFVFKDNSSHEALRAPLDPADVIGVKEFIGVKKQGLAFTGTLPQAWDLCKTFDQCVPVLDLIIPPCGPSAVRRHSRT